MKPHDEDGSLPQLPAAARRDISRVLESDLGFDREGALARFQSALSAGGVRAADLPPPRRVARTLLLAAAILTLISAVVALTRLGPSRSAPASLPVHDAREARGSAAPSAAEGQSARDPSANQQHEMPAETPRRDEPARPATLGPDAPASPRVGTSARPLASGPSSLEAETNHLVELRKVATSDPSRALTLCDEGDRRFNTGVFGVEREAIRIIALAELGRDAQAAARAKRFLERYPRGPLAQRLRAIADER